MAELLKGPDPVVPDTGTDETVDLTAYGVGISKRAALLDAKRLVPGNLGVKNYSSSPNQGALNLGYPLMNTTHTLWLPHESTTNSVYGIKSIDAAGWTRGPHAAASLGVRLNINTHLASNKAVQTSRSFTNYFLGTGTNSTVERIRYAVAQTQTKIHILIRLEVEHQDSRPTNQIEVGFYSLVYDIASGTMENVAANQEPFGTSGTGSYGPARSTDQVQGPPVLVNDPDLGPINLPGALIDVYADRLPAFAPTWDKDNNEWIFLMHRPQTVEAIFMCTFRPSDRRYVERYYSTMPTKALCVTKDHRAFSQREGGIGPNNNGRISDDEDLITAVPGSVDGWYERNYDGFANVTVVNDAHNYFVSMSGTNLNIYSGIVYGACDYDEEMAFRKAMADDTNAR